MIHLETIHRILVVCMLLFGLGVLYIPWLTDGLIGRQQVRSL
jgi:hypothetical protein